MPEDFLTNEEIVNNLLTELSKIKNANTQIEKLVKIAGDTIKTADNYHKTSLEIIARAENIFKQVEKNNIETKKRSLVLIIIIISQLIILSVLIMTK